MDLCEHTGKSMSQSGNFLHSPHYVDLCEHTVVNKCHRLAIRFTVWALCEHTVVNSVHCCDYVNTTVWISLSHSEGANSYTSSVDIFTL